MADRDGPMPIDSINAAAIIDDGRVRCRDVGSGELPQRLSRDAGTAPF